MQLQQGQQQQRQQWQHQQLIWFKRVSNASVHSPQISRVSGQPVSISPQLKSQFAISIDIMKRAGTTCVTVCMHVCVHVLQKVQILVISSCVGGVGRGLKQREKRVANVSCHVCQRAPPVDRDQPTIATLPLPVLPITPPSFRLSQVNFACK